MPRTRGVFISALFTLVFALVPALAHATWSIIAVDQKTKTVVIASATCVTSAGLASRGGLRNIQAVVVPGLGVAAAQANVDSSRKNQQLIYDEIKKGTPPSDILVAGGACRTIQPAGSAPIGIVHDHQC